MDALNAFQLGRPFIGAIAGMLFQPKREPLPSLREMAPPELLRAVVGTPPIVQPTVPLAAAPEEVLGVLRKPGCTAADETLVVKGHLEGLAAGYGGFGVLRSPDERERMRRAIQGAEQMGAPETAGKLKAAFALVGQVDDEDSAQRALEAVAPLVQETWDLGKRCGGHSFAPELVQRARELAGMVESGGLSRDAAVQELRKLREEHPGG